MVFVALAFLSVMSNVFTVTEVFDAYKLLILRNREHPAFNLGINGNVEASSITVADSLSLVCAASYSHGLVHCFNMDSGESTRVIHSPSVFGTHLSAVIYSEAGSLFYILAAPSSPNIKVKSG